VNRRVDLVRDALVVIRRDDLAVPLGGADGLALLHGGGMHRVGDGEGRAERLRGRAGGGL
jgi:hypothetical protein